MFLTKPLAGSLSTQQKIFLMLVYCAFVQSLSFLAMISSENYPDKHPWLSQLFSSRCLRIEGAYTVLKYSWNVRVVLGCSICTTAVPWRIAKSATHWGAIFADVLGKRTAKTKIWKWWRPWLVPIIEQSHPSKLPLLSCLLKQTSCSSMWKWNDYSSLKVM